MSSNIPSKRYFLTDNLFGTGDMEISKYLYYLITISLVLMALFAIAFTLIILRILL